MAFKALKVERIDPMRNATRSKHGERLNIHKATLQQWRADFARQLREVGVAANATPTAVRGKNKAWKRDGIYRALRRGQSTVVRGRVETMAGELRRGRLIPEPGKDKLLATRATVVGGWQATAALLRAHGQNALAKEVEVYVQRLPAVTTEKENIASGLLSQLATRPPRARGADGHLLPRRSPNRQRWRLSTSVG